MESTLYYNDCRLYNVEPYEWLQWLDALSIERTVQTDGSSSNHWITRIEEQKILTLFKFKPAKVFKHTQSMLQVTACNSIAAARNAVCNTLYVQHTLISNCLKSSERRCRASWSVRSNSIWQIIIVWCLAKQPCELLRSRADIANDHGPITRRLGGVRKGITFWLLLRNFRCVQDLHCKCNNCWGDGTDSL